MNPVLLLALGAAAATTTIALIKRSGDKVLVQPKAGETWRMRFILVTPTEVPMPDAAEAKLVLQPMLAALGATNIVFGHYGNTAEADVTFKDSDGSFPMSVQMGDLKIKVSALKRIS